MRIAFLFDNSTARAGALDLITYSWIQGLAESQHEIKVITNAGHVPPDHLISPRITWAEAMKTWSWFEVPRLLNSILPFAPQIIHAVLCRPLRIGQLWSMGGVVLNFRLPLIVSAGDGIGKLPQWPHVAKWLNPGSDTMELPPLNLKPRTTHPRIEKNSVFVPGPLRAHRDWRRSLRGIFATAKQNPDWKWNLGWDWSEIALSERLEWRRMAEEFAANQLQTLGSLSLQEQIEAASTAAQVRLEMLDPKSWTFGVLARSLQSDPAEHLDSAINALTRTYLNVSK